MKTLEDAQKLARAMVDIGTMAGRDMVATVSDMNQPLGEAVGNALEIKETLAILRGAGAPDLRAHCLDIAGHMLWLAGQGQRWTDEEAVRAELTERLDSGQALARFRQMVQVQGGDVAMVDSPELLPTARLIEPLRADAAGYVASVSAEGVARAAFDLGAGRIKKGEPIDFAVGVEVHVKVGQAVRAGDLLATVHANDEAKLSAALQQMREAITLSDTPVTPLPHTYETIKARARG